MRESMGAAMLPARLSAGVLAAFGGLALLLTAVGLYGVIVYSVSQRTREIGIRMALGAAWRDVVGMILRQASVMIGIGLLLGLGAALAVGQAASSLVYGVGSADPVALTAAVGTIAMVALLAAWLPARQATRIGPARSLRYE